jgi:asparagine synthase (glutamine-hydrolysing)
MRINEARIADFLENMEAIDSTSTFFEGLFRLPPAHALTVENGALRTWRYWQLTAPPIVEHQRDEDYEDAFLEVFTQAVRDRLRSPDPVGSMLSGGMDSGSVVAVAARLLHQSGAPPLRTFSAVHSDPECMESRAISLAMTLPHIIPQAVSSAAPEEFRDEVAATIRACAEPFDGHMAMIMAIYAKARRDGIRTMLDGVSGDTTISAGNIVQWHLDEGRLWQAWQEARADERFWGHFMPARQQFAKLARRKFAPPRLRAAWQQVKPLLYREHSDGTSLVSAELAQRINFVARRQQFYENTSIPNDLRSETRARRMLHPFAIAGRERYDRVAGAFGIEPRDPFLDTRLLEFCLTLPVDQIKRDGWPKRILRRSMAGLLPDDLRWRTGRTHVGGWFIAACLPLDSSPPAKDLAEGLSAYVCERTARDLIAARNNDVALAKVNDLTYLHLWARWVAEGRESGDGA